MSHGIDPLVGFNGIHFSHLSDGGKQTAWKPRPVFARKKVAGRSMVKRQFRGFDSDLLVLRALLPQRSSYKLLLDAIGTEGTLRLIPEAILDAPPERIEHLIRTDYVTFPNTTLLNVEESRPLSDGRAICQLTFERDHEEGV